MSAHLWIFLTLFAVVMQTVRTAGQKQLSAYMDAVAATLVRFLFGLPFAAAYLFAVSRWYQATLPQTNGTFWVFAVIASVTQVVATALLIYLFSLRNFAVGTTYARTEAFLTAVVGALLFGELITLPGWAAILASVSGVVVLTIARTHIEAITLLQRLWNPAAAVGLASGLCFALASLSLRKASLSLEISNFQLSAGMTLVTMVSIQTAITASYVAIKNARQFGTIFHHWRECLFVGLTSALGSIGWFTAMTLERAAYVKALGQIEFVFALGISTFFFRERSNALELGGMALIAVGVLVLVLAG
ncbi:MAG: DMT family transporter [Gammaproteobacteria bacterium]|nr:DMT family transporter [Gammaproteobacteria bacterium]